MTAPYAVIGSPVKHSKSPRIHSLFAKQTGEDVSYEAVEVSEEELAGFVRDFFKGGGKGLNVTVPHKEAVYRLVDSCTPRAELARAVNTVLLTEQGNLQGDNTDGAGLVRDLTDNHGVTLKDSAILILGAGGAARGVLPALLEQQPGSVTLLNRTLSRAASIQRDFAGLAKLAIADYDSFAAGSYDLIINATSLGLTGKVPPIPPQVVSTGTCCYDMMYGDSDTAFVIWAKTHGAALALDGLGMLVEQAAESFQLWRGVRPQTAPVIEVLRGT